MTLSRRSFLKMAGLTAVAVAGASMFTGCSLTLPIKFMAGEGDVAEVVEALNNKNIPLVPASAYKNDNYMKGYVNSLIAAAGFAGKAEYGSRTYFEADAENEAYVAVVINAVAAE